MSSLYPMRANKSEAAPRPETKSFIIIPSALMIFSFAAPFGVSLLTGTYARLNLLHLILNTPLITLPATIV